MDIRLSGHVSWIGTSSVECVVWLEQKSNNKYELLTRALFLMASRNATNTKSLIINPLIPNTDEEKLIYDGGECNTKDIYTYITQMKLNVILSLSPKKTKNFK